MARVVHFEIGADNLARAKDFYAGVFGWKIYKWEGQQEYWLVETGKAPEPGIDGGITSRMGPNIATVNTIDVASLDEAVARVTQHGGKVIMPKMAVPTVGWLAYCTDTEGNTFGMMQADPNAH